MPINAAYDRIARVDCRLLSRMMIIATAALAVFIRLPSSSAEEDDRTAILRSSGVSTKKLNPKQGTKPELKPAPTPKSSKSSIPDGKKPDGKKLVVHATNRDPKPVVTELNRELDRRLAEAKVPISPEADDAEFLRRATIDITGRIPTYASARAFLDDTDLDKRRKLIDALLADPAYGRRFGAVWKRLIQPKPENNGKPGVDRVTPWLAEQFNANRSWNEVVREMLTTEASLSRDPQAYFLAVNSESFEPKPNLLAASTARLFLGVQLGCAECHNHPFAEWKQTDFWNLAAFFSRLQKRNKSDFSLVEVGVDDATKAVIKIPEGGKAAGEIVPARFLGGGVPTLSAGVPLRNVLADWVTARDNPYFARTMVNRLWAHFFGRGLVEPLDGFQPDFAASHPEVLDRLTAEFVASGYDLQHMIRILCNTKAYGRTSRPLAENEKDTELLSRMTVKVLSPDVLYESLTTAINADVVQPIVDKNAAKNGGKFVKVVRPEPVSIGPRDEFINFFAGPAAESGSNEYGHGIPQLLRLMNSESLNVGAPLAKSLVESRLSAEEKIEELYVAVLARRPSDAERMSLAEFVASQKDDVQAYAGALWILLNTSEFVLNR